MPCFEDLLPAPHNSIVLNLLFNLATWHGYTKLRLHTEKTLKFFEMAIVLLHQSVATFQEKTSSTYYITELPQESAARVVEWLRLPRSKVLRFFLFLFLPLYTYYVNVS